MNFNGENSACYIAIFQDYVSSKLIFLCHFIVSNNLMHPWKIFRITISLR
jgi:hypothetical protein